MATPAQLKANRANARHSPGPRTAKGKARSAANSTRHGFCSQSVLLPGDDPAEYQAMLDELRGHFGPVDLTEDRFVREMADAEWRLRRVRQHQETLLTDACEELAAANPALDAAHLQLRAFDHLLATSNTLAVLMRYETKFERQYDRAYKSWSSYQDDQRRAESRAATYALRNRFQGPPNEDLTRLMSPKVQQALAELRPMAETRGTALPNEPNPAAGPSPALTADRCSLKASLPSEPNPSPKPPRNAPCPCGSGAKYKRCCGRSK